MEIEPTHYTFEVVVGAAIAFFAAWAIAAGIIGVRNGNACRAAGFDGSNITITLRVGCVKHAFLDELKK